MCVQWSHIRTYVDRHICDVDVIRIVGTSSALREGSRCYEVVPSPTDCTPTSAVSGKWFKWGETEVPRIKRGGGGGTQEVRGDAMLTYGLPNFQGGATLPPFPPFP